MYWYGWTATAALGALVIRPCCRAVARAMDTPVLAGLGVGGSRAGDDRVRLPHDALVSNVAGREADVAKARLLTV